MFFDRPSSVEGPSKHFHPGSPRIKASLGPGCSGVIRDGPCWVRLWCDLGLIRGWEAKFEKLTECLREVQISSERASSDMCLVGQEARAQSHEHDRRLAEFLRRFENVDALRASTPRRFPDFGYQTSPVGREEVSHPHNTLPHTRSARTEDPDSMETHMGSARSTLPHFESARTEEEEDAGETRNTLPHTSSARTGEQLLFRDTRTRDAGESCNTLPHTSSARTGEQILFRDTRTRDQDDDFRDMRNREQEDVWDTRTLQFRLDDRPTHEDNKGNSGEAQQSSYHPGNNSPFSRPSSSPKVPTFDGSNTAQFRPWIIQFEAIARHQGWTAGERVVRLVSSLTGPAANLLIGMTLEQLDNYNCLRTRLSRRYDPPEREEAHRAELRARTRRRNESADEFAENIKNLAQRALEICAG